MAALAEAMRRQDTPRLADLDRDAIARSINHSRNSYYAGRMSIALMRFADTVKAVLDRAGEDGAYIVTLEEKAEEAITLAIQSRRSLREEGMTPGALCNARLHNGLLQPIDGDTYRSRGPISNMRDWRDTRRYVAAPPPDLRTLPR